MMDATLELEVTRLERMVVHWPSPHVRRILPFIRPLIEALLSIGAVVTVAPSTETRQGRFVHIEYNGARFRGGYEHPKKNPRGRGGLFIFAMNGNRKAEGDPVARFDTFKDVIKFVNKPRLP